MGLLEKQGGPHVLLTVCTCTKLINLFGFDYQFSRTFIQVERTMTIALSTVFHLRKVLKDDTIKQLKDYILKVRRCTHTHTHSIYNVLAVGCTMVYFLSV